jgi:hypothetical protein
MKKLIDKLRRKLLPKAGKKTSNKNNHIPPVLLPIAKANLVREQQLAHCKQACDIIVKKLKNKEPLSPQDYAQTMLVINTLADKEV